MLMMMLLRQSNQSARRHLLIQMVLTMMVVMMMTMVLVPPNETTLSSWHRTIVVEALVIPNLGIPSGHRHRYHGDHCQFMMDGDVHVSHFSSTRLSLTDNTAAAAAAAATSPSGASPNGSTPSQRRRQPPVPPPPQQQQQQRQQPRRRRPESISNRNSNNNNINGSMNGRDNRSKHPPSTSFMISDNQIASIETPSQLKGTIHEIATAMKAKDDTVVQQEAIVTQTQCDGLMGLCVAMNQWEYVLEVLDIMRLQGFVQERSTYRACLKACLDFGNPRSAKSTLRAMEKAGVKPRPADIGLVISTMCGGNRRWNNHRDTKYNEDDNDDDDDDDEDERGSRTPTWRNALSLLKASATRPTNNVEMEKDETAYYSKVIPLQAYNDVLNRLKEERQWKEAIRLLRYMETGAQSGVAITGKGSMRDTPSTIREKENLKTGKSRPVQSASDESSTVVSSSSDMRNDGFIIPTPGLATYHAVIECCAISDEADQAVQLLYSMRDRGLKPRTSTFQIVLSMLSRRLQWRRALTLLDVMEEMDVTRTVINYNTVISACARAREVGTAKNLLSRMKTRDKIAPDVISYNSVIGACAGTARWKDALDVLDQCYREPGVTPNIYTYTNAMKACARGGKTQRALNLLQVVKDKNLPLDSYCYTAVIDACAKAKMWQKALALFDEMVEKGIEPTEVTYSVTISALGSGLQWERALGLLNTMREKGMSLNLITYNAAITALAKAARQNARDSEKAPSVAMSSTREGSVEVVDVAPKEAAGAPNIDLWKKALGLLQQMKDDGIEPDGFCYSSAISCCGAEGRWKEACELIEIMKKGGPRTRPNKVAYTAAISACGRAGESRNALELFQTMKDEGLSPDRVAFNALFSALRKANDGERSYELWGEICGVRSMTTRAIATAHHAASPDIITVTDCIATLSRNGMIREMDEVFGQAVERGIVLRSNSLDGQWEVDLSGMPFPVARAACRYLLKQIQLHKSAEDLQDIVFITGVGMAQQRRRENVSTQTDFSATSVLEKNPTTSLRDYVQGILRSDLEPPLESTIPERAKGTVMVGKPALTLWLEAQKG